MFKDHSVGMGLPPLTTAPSALATFKMPAPNLAVTIPGVPQMQSVSSTQTFQTTPPKSGYITIMGRQIPIWLLVAGGIAAFFAFRFFTGKKAS